MTTYQPLQSALQHRFSESDLDRFRCVLKSDGRRVDSQSEHYWRDSASPAHSLQSSHSSCTSPEPPPVPPKDDLPVEHARYESKKQKGRSWAHLSAIKNAILRMRTRGGRKRDVSKLRPILMSILQPSSDFVGHVGWEEGTTGRDGSPQDSAHMMSGALVDGDTDSGQQDSLIPESLDLDDAELSELAKRHLRARESSFDRNSAAADFVRPTGFDVSSDIFSNHSIHILSRCASPPTAPNELGNRVLERRLRGLAIENACPPFVDRLPGTDAFTVSANAPRTGIAATLPTEVLQAIYDNLSPLDFNAARHTCISWMCASLSVDILAEQLRRGGWWTKASRKVSFLHDWQPWPMSCYFARECALAGDWTGQGISSCGEVYHSPMIESREADFRPFVQSTSGSSDEHTKCEPICMTSICGRYVVRTAGAEIYTYEIEGRLLRLLSRTSCERRVLAVTVDVTSERFVIAALLEGRIGLYIDMIGSSEPGVAKTQWESAGTLNNTSTASAPVMDFGDNDGAGSSEVAAGEFDELSMNAGSVGESTFLHQSVEIVTQRTWPEYVHGGRARLRGIRQLPPLSGNGVWPSALNFNEKGKGKKLDVRSLPQVVYRNTCFEDDPPISIAISPTRQCVAFGCKAGVELYWIDPTTGRNLNRYFPLAKPSDHLYFLPPRRNIDSTLRLRLISSATYTPPNEEDKEKQPSQNPQTSFWFTLTGPWRFPIARTARQQAHGVDHSYAVPLSDGHHILFTDNETVLLCLGSDKPVGNLQRLSRKFVFQPPIHMASDAESWTPRLYSATNTLDNGVRIVAAYADNIILYTVPIDALKYSTAEQEETVQDSCKPFEELGWLDILPHPTSNVRAIRETGGSPIRCERLNMMWAHYLPSFGENRLASLDTLWPLRLNGTFIGTLDGLSALSVQETVMDGLVVWAFGASGLAEAWEVDNGYRLFEKTYSTILSNGIVREGQRPVNDGDITPDQISWQGETPMNENN